MHKTLNETSNHPAKTILLGAGLAGALDITAACLNSAWQGRPPRWVFQSVAGGWLGRATFQGGWKTAWLGLGLHFFIATVAMAVYYALSTRLGWLTRQAVLSGALYGAAVYLFMYALVLPLSAYQSRFLNQTSSAILIGLLIHIFCVGLPIALVTRKYKS